jgi:hypothetical protein
MHESHGSRIIDFNAELEQEQPRDRLMLITEQYHRINVRFDSTNGCYSKLGCATYI